MPDEQKPGCLLARLPTADAARFSHEIDKMIPEDEVDPAEGGYERDTHITVLYGFSPDVSLPELKKFLRGMTPFHMKLTTIRSFKKDDGSAVLKVDVESPGLHKLNTALAAEFEVKSDYERP